MLFIDKSQQVGRGVDRVVYAHPHDPTLCIKIARNDFSSEYMVKGVRDHIYHALRGFRKEYFDYNYTDVEYADRLGKKGDTSEVFRHLPQCYGYVESNLGRGVLWQRIQNYDGSTCLSLRECYFTPGLLGDNESDILWPAFNDFFSWQLQHGIMLREMAFANTLICRITPETIRLYHVDAIGCVDLFPLANHAQWFARLRIQSKIRRFKKHLIQWLGKPGQ